MPKTLKRKKVRNIFVYDPLSKQDLSKKRAKTKRKLHTLRQNFYVIWVIFGNCVCKSVVKNKIGGNTILRDV